MRDEPTFSQLTVLPRSGGLALRQQSAVRVDSARVVDVEQPAAGGRRTSSSWARGSSTDRPASARRSDNVFRPV